MLDQLLHQVIVLQLTHIAALTTRWTLKKLANKKKHETKYQVALRQLC
jgi:hypothetical protein